MDSQSVAARRGGPDAGSPRRPDTPNVNSREEHLEEVAPARPRHSPSSSNGVAPPTGGQAPGGLPARAGKLVQSFPQADGVPRQCSVGMHQKPLFQTESHLGEGEPGRLQESDRVEVQPVAGCLLP